MLILSLFLLLITDVLMLVLCHLASSGSGFPKVKSFEEFMRSKN